MPTKNSNDGNILRIWMVGTDYKSALSGYFYGDRDLELNYQNAAQAPADTIFKYGPEFLKLDPTNLSVNYGMWKTYEKSNDRN